MKLDRASRSNVITTVDRARMRVLIRTEQHQNRHETKQLTVKIVTSLDTLPMLYD